MLSGILPQKYPTKLIFFSRKNTRPDLRTGLLINSFAILHTHTLQSGTFTAVPITPLLQNPPSDVGGVA